MAQVNRDAYVQSGFRIDAGGDAGTWSAVLQALTAVPTNVVPQSS
jgi:hypothetical protein